MIIAIDGPAASGKGTLAKKLAVHYGLRHLDTGLLYRAVALAVLTAGHKPGDRDTAIAAAKTIDPAKFDETQLKRYDVGEAASVVSAIPEVRAALCGFEERAALAAAISESLDLAPSSNGCFAIQLCSDARADSASPRRSARSARASAGQLRAGSRASAIASAWSANARR